MRTTPWPACQPVDLHNLARQWFVGARRIELQKLAVELGVSRATVYRWAGSAEQLVGDVLASLVDDAFERIAARTRGTGGDRVLEVLERGMRLAYRFDPLRAFLARNPAAGLKIVASKHGPVQGRTIHNLERLMIEEIEAGRMQLSVEPGVMAYALTRMVESFLYADLIAGEAEDLDNAVRIMRLMLRDPTEAVA